MSDRKQRNDLLVGQYRSPFGSCRIGLRDGRLVRLSFGHARLEDSDGGLSADQLSFCPGTTAVLPREETVRWGQAIFERPWSELEALPVHLEGTPFQQGVWQVLRGIPPGRTCSYGDLARQVGAAKAARAVGQAVAANPLAYVVPCHRVLPVNGGLGGYRWGKSIKAALLAREGGSKWSNNDK